MILWVWFVILGAQVSAVSAESAESATSKISFLKTEPYSCRILRHRVMDRLKGHAGLSNLTAEQANDFRAYLGRSGYFPKYYFEQEVAIVVEWNLPPDWAQIFDSKSQISVEWSFKGVHWQEETGILLNEVEAKWRSTDSTLEISTVISPVELCFLPSEMRLVLSSEGKSLALTSDTEWL